MKLSYLSRVLSVLVFFSFLSMPAYAGFEHRGNIYSHSILPEVLGEYWWDGKPEYTQYAGKHHFILDEDGKGVFDFTGGTSVSFKWGIQTDTDDKARLYKDAVKEFGDCYMLLISFEDGNANQLCVDIEIGRAITATGKDPYQKK